MTTKVKNAKVGTRVKAVDRDDNFYKVGTVVNVYSTFQGRKVDIAFDDSPNKISTGHFLQYVIIIDTE